MPQADTALTNVLAATGAGMPAPDPYSQLPRPQTPDAAAKLQPGSRFVDPQGQLRTVPYRPKTLEEADVLPEGAHFVDPSGKLRQVPTYGDLDFTTQTLYNMAANNKERRKILEQSYPGGVKQNPRTGEFYVDYHGKLIKPRGFSQSPLAFATAQAAPVAGSIAGEVLGGFAGALGGSALPVVGTAAGGTAGAIGGAAAGGAAGQAFNDAILGLAGVYDRSGGEEAEQLALSGLAGGGGTAIGRGLGAVAPAVKGYIRNALPGAAAKFLGADKEALAQAIRLRAGGSGPLVAPSRWAKESPHLHLMVEKFDPTFHTQNPLLQSATKYYEENAKRVLENLGAKVPKSITEPEAAVSTEKTGEALLGRSRAELADKDAHLRASLEAARATAQAGAGTQSVYMASLRAAEKESRDAADKVINQGFKAIDADIQTAMAAVKAGKNSGELWAQVGDKLRKIRLAIGQRAKIRYAQADQLAGAHLPNIEGLPQLATDMLAQMPQSFEGRYPAIVKQIRDLAGVEELDKAGNPTGKWKVEPAHPTFGQLHQLRTALRNSVNYYDLTPDFKEGALKFFANKVDAVLHDQEAGPELQAAAHMLDATDAWYGKVIKPLTDKNIQAVLSGLESGLPADPKVLYNTIVKEGRTELTNKVRKLVGPTLWSAVKAADAQDMLDSAKTLTPGVIDGRRFAREVLDRYRSGMLEAVHGPQSAKLLEQARNIEALEGRLDIPSAPGDTISEVVRRARLAAEVVKEQAKRDPLALLNKEMKNVEREHAREAARLRQQRLNDSLAFLYKPTTGATEAVDKILGNEDLILAAAARFGPSSPEFNMLRQVWAQRILQAGMQPGKHLEKVSEEVQRVMFPGVTLDQMRLLAKDMDFLMGRSELSHGMAGLSAIAKVEHPFGGLPAGKTVGKILNVATLGFGAPLARGALGTFYKLVREGVNNPAFLRWVEKGLKGDDAARALVRATVQRRMQFGGAIGAGAGQALYQTPNQNLPFEPLQR